MFASLILFLCLFFQPGQGRQGQFPPAQQPSPAPATTAPSAQTGQAGQPGQGGPGGRAQAQPSPSPEETPVVTKHEIHAGSRVLRYTATTGMMPIKNREGETEARIFYMAYTLDDAGPRNRRPVTFAFNGGPGSASVWLHLGAIGP